MQTIECLQSLVASEIDEEINHLSNIDPLNLYGPVAYALSMGGKRLRPTMVLLGYNLFGDDLDKAMPIAMAIELFHNFTLLHDDIMDRAEMRRSNESVYKKYGDNVAILSGDAMSIMAYNYLLKSTSPALTEMISLFSQTALEVCEGQQFDMDFETRDDVSIDDYIEMIRLKTAVLLACSLKIGALAADAPRGIANQLYVFGLNLGIAFQLQDDLLDVFADEYKFGKKLGGDISSDKKTFLLLKAFELAGDSEKECLLKWVGHKGEDAAAKVEAITEVFNKLDIKEITDASIDHFFRKALDVYNEIDMPIEKKSVLLELASLIINRDH